MPTDAQLRLAAFYDEIVRRAYSGACNHWCRWAPDPADGEGVALVPRDYGNRQDFLDAWPALPIGPGNTREPAFLLDRYAVEQAFTRILQRDSDIPLSDDTNLIVQVAVFGRIVFG